MTPFELWPVCRSVASTPIFARSEKLPSARATPIAALRPNQPSALAGSIARSSAAKPPATQCVDRAVTLTPNSGSAIRREKKTSIGVANSAAFSVKNGRFSGRNTSNR